MSKKSTIDTKNKASVIDLTEGTVLGGAYLSSKSYFSEFTDFMIALTAIREAGPLDIVTISSEAVNVTDRNRYGFKVGDMISVQDLLTCFMLTGAEDARNALIEHIAGKESTYIAMMNSTARSIGLINTNYVNVSGEYDEDQGTMIYDLYSILYELMSYDWYTTLTGPSKAFITYKNLEGKTVRKACVNVNRSTFGKIMMPSEMSYVAMFSKESNALGNGQVVITEGTNGHFYMSILLEVDPRREIREESRRLLEVVNGELYYDLELAEEAIPVVTIPPEEPKVPTPTVTPAPEPTPIAYKANTPTESNDARYQYLLGRNYKAFTVKETPKGYENRKEAEKNMRVITVPVWKMNTAGRKYASTMKLSIHKKLAEDVAKIFKEIYALPTKFPFKTLTGFGYRKVGGVGLVKSTLLSAHAFGAAIDINPGDYDNDYYLGKGNDLRDKTNPYYIPDEVVAIFASYGWFWGGDFAICSDTMHFQYLGLEFLTYQGKSPFRELKYHTSAIMSGSDVMNLQQRLTKLGFKVMANGSYNKATETAMMKFQKKYKLESSGVVDYKTWEKIINLTHYMGYVF